MKTPSKAQIEAALSTQTYLRLDERKAILIAACRERGIEVTSVTPFAALAAKLRAVLIIVLVALGAGCAGARPYTPHVQIPPRLVLKPTPICVDMMDLEPLPFRKHPLAELEAAQATREAAHAAELRAHPERDALEFMAKEQIQQLLEEWEEL